VVHSQIHVDDKSIECQPCSERSSKLGLVEDVSPDPSLAPYSSDFNEFMVARNFFGEVKKEPRDMVEDTEFLENSSFLDQSNVLCEYSGDQKPKCDWKLLVRPFVLLDKLI
jgi:hypothetical protein